MFINISIIFLTFKNKLIDVFQYHKKQIIIMVNNYNMLPPPTSITIMFNYTKTGQMQ